MVYGVNEEMSRENFTKMEALFQEKAGERFSVFYGYGSDFDMIPVFRWLRGAHTSYVNFIIGYDESANEMAVVVTNPTLDKASDAVFFSRDAIIGAKHNRFLEEYTIFDARLKKDGLWQFTVPHETRDSEKHICVMQKERAKAFHDFFIGKFQKKKA